MEKSGGASSFCIAFCVLGFCGRQLRFAEVGAEIDHRHAPSWSHGNLEHRTRMQNREKWRSFLHSAFAFCVLSFCGRQLRFAEVGTEIDHCHAPSWATEIWNAECECRIEKSGGAFLNLPLPSVL